jgi:hypothetical protein
MGSGRCSRQKAFPIRVGWLETETLCLTRRRTPIESDAPWLGCNRPGSTSENNVARIDLTPWIDPPTDLFDQAGEIGLWRSVLREKGPEWRMLADEPDHPESN